MANWVADFLTRNPDLAARPIAARAKHAIHFNLGDRERIAYFTGKPVHYLDGGLWKPIDTKLLVASGGFYGAPHSDVRIHTDGRVQVAGTDYQQLTALPGSPTGSLDNDRIVREFTFGRQILFITEDGFKQEIILNRIPTLTEAQACIASVTGTLPIKYFQRPTIAIDSSTPRNKVHTFTTLAALRTWLATVVYPVTIDPDFASSTASHYTIYSLNSTYSTARTTSSAVDASIWIGCSKPDSNYEVDRSFIKFDTSTIGAGSTVTQVNLTMTCVDDTSGTNFDVDIKKCDWSALDPISSYRENAYDAALAADQDDSIWRNTNGIATNTPYASGNLSTSYVKKTAATYYALMNSLDSDNTTPTGNNYIGIAKPDHATPGYRPVLAVTYTAAGNPWNYYAQS